MLTLKMLKEMAPHTIIATGCMEDNPLGLYMAGTGRMLRWVAVRGGIHDWAIYAHFASDHTVDDVRREGDKVIMENNIKRLVPCDDEAFAMYRY